MNAGFSERGGNFPSLRGGGGRDGLLAGSLILDHSSWDCMFLGGGGGLLGLAAGKKFKVIFGFLKNCYFKYIIEIVRIKFSKHC